jgi:hypothetical protein
MTMMLKAIKAGIDSGKYRVDAERGKIFGPEQELQIKRHPGAHCPCVRLHVDGLPKNAYSVPAHKVIAYSIWGEAAFVKGIHVRHLDGNNENSTKANLALGTPAENEMDKPAWVRSRSATLARAAQPSTSFNAKLKAESIGFIRQALSSNRLPSGRVRRGVVQRLAKEHGVSSSTISLVGKNKTWA